MENNKVITKNWDMTKVSKEFNPVDLLENWKKAKLNEISLRKSAFKNKENFKKWWFIYLKAEGLQTRVRIQFNEYKNNPKATDEEKDFVDEADRIDKEIKKSYEKLSKVTKLMVKNRKKVLSFIASDEVLKKYKTKITLDFLNNEGHDISDEDVKARNATWGVGVLRKIWEALERDKEFEPIRDENGRKIREIKTWRDGAASWNPAIRQKMFESWYSWDLKHRQTMFELCSYIAARLQQNAEYYKYDSWVEQSVREQLQLDVKDYYYILDGGQRFAKGYLDFNSYDESLVAKAYGLKKFEPWDVDLRINDTDDSVTQAQAKEKIFDSLSCLGKEYLEKVQSCFDNNVIYWSKEERKLTGYCVSGTALLDEHPIYFNWDGTTKSVATLAHELGHNVAAKLIKENNKIDNEHNNLFAEIPSIVNTVIFSLYWIKTLKETKAPKTQLYRAYTYLLEYLCETICWNGYNYQLADLASNKLLNEDWKYYDFELWALGLESRCCGMTKTEYFNRKKKWPYQLQNLNAYRLYISAALNQDVAITYYLGSILALVIGVKIFNGDKVTLNKYLKFLKTGTSIDPIKTVKDVLGINLLKPQIYTESKQNFEKLIKDFKHDIKI